MAPRNAKASTSTSSNPRKRRQSDQEATSSTSQLLPATASLGTLDFGSDGEVEQEDDGDVLDRDSEPEEAFPEVNLEDSDPEDDSFDGSADEEDFEDEDEDEEALLAELEAEEEEEDGDLLSDSEQDPSDLDELIRRNTSKPIEDEAPTPFTALEALEQEGVMRDYMKRSRVVKSDVTGKDLTVWDDEIDAEYASDSSTEEVSPNHSTSSRSVNAN
jgi:ribosome biogenesis protein ERB1